MEMHLLSQSPTEDKFVQDPYPFYRDARAHGDFFYWEDYGFAVASTHEAVTKALKSKKLGREVPLELRQPVRAGLELFYDLEAHSMLELERPAHTRLRGLVLKAFTRNRISCMAPEISMIADALIDDFPSGKFDLLEKFARDSKILDIFEGTQQIQQLIVARRVLEKSSSELK